MQILQADNNAQVIPLIERELLEMDIQIAMCSCAFTVAKDLLVKVQLLNTLRRICTHEIINIDFAHCLRNSGDKGIDFFISVCTYLFSLKFKKATA